MIEKEGAFAFYTLCKNGRLMATKWSCGMTYGQRPAITCTFRFQQKRKGIFWDCHNLKVAVDSYNDAHPKEEQIEMVYNFEMDLAEHEAAEDDDAA